MYLEIPLAESVLLWPRHLRVLVGDDNENVSRAICQILRSETDIEVVGEATGSNVESRWRLLSRSREQQWQREEFEDHAREIFSTSTVNDS